MSRVPCTAGSCVVFTETLRHCSLPWVGDGERRTVFLKFSPAGDAFRKPAEERAAQYRALAPRAAAADFGRDLQFARYLIHDLRYFDTATRLLSTARAFCFF